MYKVAIFGGVFFLEIRRTERETEREERDDDEEEDFNVRGRSTARRKTPSSSESSSAEVTAARTRRSKNIKKTCIIDARGFGGACRVPACYRARFCNSSFSKFVACLRRLVSLV